MTSFPPARFPLARQFAHLLHLTPSPLAAPVPVLPVILPQSDIPEVPETRKTQNTNTTPPARRLPPPIALGHLCNGRRTHPSADHVPHDVSCRLNVTEQQHFEKIPSIREPSLQNRVAKSPAIRMRYLLC